MPSPPRVLAIETVGMLENEAGIMGWDSLAKSTFSGENKFDIPNDFATAALGLSWASWLIRPQWSSLGR
jgi:hypothetical protein